MFISRLQEVIEEVEKPKQLSSEWTLFVCSSYIKNKNYKIIAFITQNSSCQANGHCLFVQAT
jgi:hypothetical protein